MYVVQLLVLLVLAPGVQGVMSTLRARLNGRSGPSPLQPYRNVRKLWNKEALVPKGVSPIVLVAPAVLAGVAITVAALVPVLFQNGSRSVDAVAIVLTLALGRFVLILAALDTRSQFGAMAASREIAFASLTEAPLLLALLSLSFGGGGVFPGLLAGSALLVVCLSETARIPVDNQETHYELTMIHEGTILEYSGWHLALLQYASWVRQLALFVLVAMLLPGSAPQALAWIALIVIVIPLIERTFAKMRLFEVPALFASATILALASIAVRLAAGSV